jgi:alpha-N-arabinofuranosidase
MAQPVEINLTGAGNIANSGTLISLTGSNDAETNTISAPTRIVPVKSALKSVAANFVHVMPAYSVEVIELLAK